MAAQIWALYPGPVIASLTDSEIAPFFRTARTWQNARRAGWSWGLAMTTWTDPEGRTLTDQPRHCWGPNAKLLTWCASIGDDGVRRHMYRLGHRSIGEDEGEELRKRWGGGPD